MKKYVIVALLFLIILTGCANIETEELSPEIKKIKDRGKLIVGSDIPYSVMEFFDDSGNAVGIDVDIAQEIANHLEVELEVIDYDWDLLFDAVKSGEVDIAMASITITPERAEEMLFSIPYFNGGQILVISKDNQEIKGPLDLSDKKIGVQKETTSEIEAKKYTNESMIVRYLGYDLELIDSGMLYDLKTGVIDVIIIDYVAAIDIIRYEPTLKTVGDTFTEEFYGVVTAKKNAALVNEINTVLRDLKRTRKINEIIDNYLE